jgi:asparagine synthase (glutamine-hydrolysing)
VSYFTPLSPSRRQHLNLYRIKDNAARHVSDEAMAGAKERYPVDTPDTKEAYFIREIFECQSSTSVIPLFHIITDVLRMAAHFPTKAAAETAVRWIPRMDWGCSSDPSGRSVAIHAAAYGNDGDE